VSISFVEIQSGRLLSLTVQSFLTRYGLSSIQCRVFVKLSVMFYNMHRPSAPLNLRTLLAHERRFVPYNLRRHCQIARNRFVNSHSDLQLDAVYVEWCNATEILNFNFPFKDFLSYIWTNVDSFYQKFITRNQKFNIDNFRDNKRTMKVKIKGQS
jgi:hypothetical protein